MSIPLDYSQFYRVTSTATKVPPSHTPEKNYRDRYEHIVGFNDSADHQEVLRDYLNFYCRINPDGHDAQSRGLHRQGELIASAILAYYLRAAVNRWIDVQDSRFTIEDELPKGELVHETATCGVWLVSREKDPRSASHD